MEIKTSYEITQESVKQGAIHKKWVETKNLLCRLKAIKFNIIGEYDLKKIIEELEGKSDCINKMGDKKLTDEQGGAHLILAYNVQAELNEIFTKYPESTIDKDGFMKLQQKLWKNVKKATGLGKILNEKES